MISGASLSDFLNLIYYFNSQTKKKHTHTHKTVFVRREEEFVVDTFSYEHENEEWLRIYR